MCDNDDPEVSGRHGQHGKTLINKEFSFDRSVTPRNGRFTDSVVLPVLTYALES